MELRTKEEPFAGSTDGYKNRTVAGIYGVTLGALGVHRFYLGYTGIGIAQILVTLLTCGVGALWGIIEGWIILWDGGFFDKDARGNPLVKYAEPLPTESGAGDDTPVAGQKNRATAAMYGVFLGAFGVHRFYLGYTAIGVIQVAVTFLTCGLGALWGMLEGFLILSGKIDKDAQGRPLGKDVEIVVAEANLSEEYTYKNKTIAGILGVFLGSLGIHRFYLGYTGIGIAQLLLTFSTGLGAIWGLVEGILILTGTINKDAQGRPLINYK
ncbi:TM2 domain-containing protein [Candidatus Magnetobacterium casense]|uniref:TM2 domain-containing protein n=1 Tax=Candidatus Magnetobacterium casense TaxID=1455061 RepID=UPI0006964E85|nr:TM2 domain-containing protein [Candidatus Magnetobacterium casensis]